MYLRTVYAILTIQNHPNYLVNRSILARPKKRSQVTGVIRSHVLSQQLYQGFELFLVIPCFQFRLQCGIKSDLWEAGMPGMP
jgi:hypothetical protein